MSAKRIAMRKIREILRLRLEAGLSVRQIHASAKVSVGAIQKLLKKILRPFLLRTIFLLKIVFLLKILSFPKIRKIPLPLNNQ